MKTIVEIVQKTSIFEIVLFAGVVCLALTAGYASLASKTTVTYNDITGSSQQVKLMPSAQMQPMPAPVDQR